MPRVSCACGHTAEQIREGDAVEDCPICGGVRLARPPVSVASAMLRATDEDAPREVQGPPVGACSVVINLDDDCKHIEQSVAASISGALRQMADAKPDLLVVPPALEACARQISGPDKCPVCQGRYPDAAAELAFREEVAAEALEDCREDLAEALGKGEDDEVNNDWYAMLALVRRLASPPAPQEAGASKVEHFRAGQDAGLQEAHNTICQVAEGLAAKASKGFDFSRELQALMTVAGLVRDRANQLRDADK